MSSKTAAGKRPGKIRRARKSDVPAILELIAENPDTILPRTAEELADLVRTTWVAEEKGRVVGSCCLEIYSKKICEVRTLAVLRDFRDQGYGRRLVRAVVREANRRGIHQILSITSARSFFEKLGFGSCLREKYALFWRGTSGAKG